MLFLTRVYQRAGRKRALIGYVSVLAIVLYVLGPDASEQRPLRLDIQDENRNPVHLAAGGGGEAYQDAVETFARHYGDTIERANPLVHEMFMRSEGAATMTKADTEELGGLLSDMGYAPDSGVIGSYPKGYEDCAGYLRTAATSLSLAADSVRGFNQSADMEYLRDYRRLTAMYMRAAADAQWCVSDRLH